MEENKNTVHLFDGVADKAKDSFNENTSEVITLFLDSTFEYLKEKTKNIPSEIEKIISNKKAQKEIMDLWSVKLYEKGLVPKGYSRLPDELLISNFQQTGYLDGLYAGYALAMMALVDNGADEDLILSVRDDVRPNLIRHHYKDRDEFFDKYKEEKYRFVESLSKDKK